jgi:hypothetical protein
MKKSLLIVPLASAALILASTPANAIETEKSGKCSAGSIWQADLELEYRVFDLGFEIDTKNADENWNFTLRQNGKRVVSENRPAVKDFDDSYAEVEWDLIRPDRKGSDTFTFRAVNQTSGEVCKATLKA